MVKSLSNRFVAVFMAVIFLLLFTLGINSYALDTKGSISIALETVDGNPMEGAQIRLYKVALLDNNSFVYTSEFTGCDASLDDVKEKETADLIYEYAITNMLTYDSSVSTSSGFVSFTDLDLGVYLVCQSNSVSGFEEIAPFMVTVPNYIDGHTVYDVDASPKTVVTETVNASVTKIWNDDGESRPSSITVALKKGNSVVDEVTLSAENNWKYEWSNLSYSDSYSVIEVNVPKGYIATYRHEGLDFIIENTPKLPQTGQLNWPVPVMATAGVFFVILGIFVGMKKDEKETDSI